MDNKIQIDLQKDVIPQLLQELDAVKINSLMLQAENRKLREKLDQAIQELNKNTEKKVEKGK